MISTVFYVAVGVVAVGLVGASRLSGSDSPLVEAISATGSAASVYVISAGALMATASVLLTSILGVSRVAYAMARRRDLPEALSRLHNRHNTPYYSIWAIGILMALLVLFVDLTNVVSTSTFASLFYYALANIAALRFEARVRKYSRVVPALGAATCIAFLILVLFIRVEAWIIGASGLAAGIIFYALKKGSLHRVSSGG